MGSPPRRVEDVFLAALDTPPGGERSAYLDEACADDPPLRRRVEELLEAHEQANRYLEVPCLAAEPGATVAPDAAGDDDEGDALPDCLGPPAHPGQLGTLGPYEITEVLGRGGMGVVLKGFDPRLHRSVAIKVLAPGAAGHPTARRRFLREARAAAAISHDHVVTIFAVDESGRLPYLVMEYVHGISLEDLIRRKGGLGLAEILRIGLQVASGLAAAHAQGLVHRDIKPANILLENGVQRVKITDFGLARAVDDAAMTQPGQVAGTPLYMAPEQARGGPIDRRADLFSLGSVLYAMCTGRPPFRAETTMGVLRRVCEDTPRPIREVNPEIPDWLCAIVERLLEKDPDDRIQTAEEAAGRIGEGLAHVQEPDARPRPEVLRRSGRSSRARPLRAAGELVLGVALCVLLVVAVRTVRGYLAGVASRGGLAPRAAAPAMAPATPPVVPDRSAPGTPREIGLARRHFEGEHAGNGSGVYAVAVAPDGRRALTGHFGGAVCLWDMETGREIRNLEGHEATLQSVAVSPDGRLGVSGDEDGAIILWDLEAEARLLHVPGHSGRVQGLAFAPGGDAFVSGSTDLGGGGDNTVRLWETALGREIRQFPGRLGHVQHVAVSPDGGLVAACEGGAGQVLLWRRDTGDLVRRIRDPASHGLALAFTPDGRHLLAGFKAVELRDGLWDDPAHAVIRMWDLESGRVAREFEGHRSSVVAVAVSPDGRRLLSASAGRHDGEGIFRPAADETVRLWDLDSGRELCRYRPDERVHALAFAPDGRTFLTAGDDSLRQWDVPKAAGEASPGGPDL